MSFLSPVKSQLILSTFTGAGLLDRAFREMGFVVVSAGDIIYGQDIREFKGMVGKFDGVIGGPPCQDFSALKRNKSDYSHKMLSQYIRIIEECQPTWWLMENVRGVPTIDIDGYEQQRIDVNQGWYSETSRLRHIQFGRNDGGSFLDIPRGDMSGVKESCALASDDRSFREICTLQGLEDDYNLPDFTVAGKKKMVGNGVPLVLGRVLAKEVLKITTGVSQSVTDPGRKTTSMSHSVTQQQNLCRCGCKRSLSGRKIYYDSSCRKRAERNRKVS